jgi:hypothetical protein
VKWCAVDWGQRFSNLAVLVGLVNFVIVKGTHVYLVLGENVRKEGSCEYEGCAKGAKGSTFLCIAHGGGTLYDDEVQPVDSEEYDSDGDDER